MFSTQYCMRGCGCRQQSYRDVGVSSFATLSLLGLTRVSFYALHVKGNGERNLPQVWYIRVCPSTFHPSFLFCVQPAFLQFCTFTDTFPNYSYFQAILIIACINKYQTSFH